MFYPIKVGGCPGAAESPKAPATMVEPLPLRLRRCVCTSSSAKVAAFASSTTGGNGGGGGGGVDLARKKPIIVSL